MAPICPYHCVLVLALPLSLAVVISAAQAQEAPAVPRPEHPRPQMKRAEWLNLNGVWDFAETDDDQDESFLTAERYPDRIVVPFCRESKLSGLARRGFVKNVWYRRPFEVPGDWRSPRVRLHVGACDWAARVWVNGRLVGRHVGGSAPFTFDITDVLKPGPNTIIIHAHDDTRSGKQALGKQSTREESHSIFYTRTTGIWQTVWLEGVGSTFIRRYAVAPDPDHERVLLAVGVDGACRGLALTASVAADGQPAGQAAAATVRPDTRLVLPLSKKHLWSPADPFLYDLTFTLSDGQQTVDRLEGYFGLRTVSIEGRAILINDRPIFQRLVLDQGFYPDGVWTAPTDSDLRRDITLSQALGLNGARLHQKVFEPRFLYWADKLGYLVWGEYPSFGANYADPAVNLPILDEWRAIVERDYNHPSIVGWCPFNETPREAGELQNVVARLTRLLDPTRPVLDTSGWTHSLPDAELIDAHDYNQDPESFRRRWMAHFGDVALPARYGRWSRSIPFFVSEYGGIGWSVGQGWGYGQTPKSLDDFYARYAGLTNALLDNRMLFGFCYTQLTDVEQEKNGLYTFERQAKFDAEKLRMVNARSARYEEQPHLDKKAPPVKWTVLVGASPDGELARPWRYLTEPPADDWTKPDFNDADWRTGRGGFGDKPGWEDFTRTVWRAEGIWLRQAFDHDGSDFAQAALAIHHDHTAEVYLNGQRIFDAQGENTDYTGYDVTPSVRGVLRKGRNTLAVHCRQPKGQRYIDVALLIAASTK